MVFSYVSLTWLPTESNCSKSLPTKLVTPVAPPPGLELEPPLVPEEVVEVDEELDVDELVPEERTLPENDVDEYDDETPPLFEEPV